MADEGREKQIEEEIESNCQRRGKSRSKWMEEYCDYLLEDLREADHDRDWYQENDPQSLVDSINAANMGNTGGGGHD